MILKGRGGGKATKKMAVSITQLYAGVGISYAETASAATAAGASLKSDFADAASATALLGWYSALGLSFV